MYYQPLFNLKDINQVLISPIQTKFPLKLDALVYYKKLGNNNYPIT